MRDFRENCLVRMIGGFGVGLFLFASSVPNVSAADNEVDLALVLSMDCSSSVDASEFRLQMEGLGRAFRRAEVKAAIKAGTLQRIAVAVVEWSGKDNQATVIGWTIIASDGDADRLGVAIAGLALKLEPTATSISSALLYSEGLLKAGPVADRQVIDVSTDGPNNIGAPVKLVRDQLTSKGIIINALAIRNEWRTLNDYLEREVAGGDGHFVVPALDYSDYADAIYRKLLKEITGPGIS